MDRVILILFGISTGTAVALVCALCAARPDKMAVYIQNRYLQSPKWVRGWPFASMVMKSWYPIYLRWMGLAGFLCTLIWLGLVIRQFSK
jgi:hypothetical protein